jgi:excisionase family DNA binding protein
VDPLLVPIFTEDESKKPDAAQMLGLGRSMTKQLVATGELETVTVGRRRLVIVESIREYVMRKRTATQVNGEAA